MDNIRQSFWGYNKKDVHDLILEKDQLIDTQKKDIDYLRKENTALNQIVNQNNSKKEKVNSVNPEQKQSRVVELEQKHLDTQKEMS